MWFAAVASMIAALGVVAFARTPSLNLDMDLVQHSPKMKESRA